MCFQLLNCTRAGRFGACVLYCSSDLTILISVSGSRFVKLLQYVLYSTVSRDFRGVVWEMGGGENVEFTKNSCQF